MLVPAWPQTSPADVATCRKVLKVDIPTVRMAELPRVSRTTVMKVLHAAHALSLSSRSTFRGRAHVACAVTVAASGPVGTRVQILFVLAPNQKVPSDVCVTASPTGHLVAQLLPWPRRACRYWSVTLQSLPPVVVHRYPLARRTVTEPPAVSCPGIPTA